MSEEEIEDIDDDVTPPTPALPLSSTIKPPPKHTKKKEKNLTKQPSVDRKDKKEKKVTNSSNSNAKKEVRCFVFSTAMANRAGHAVSKGMFVKDFLISSYLSFYSIFGSGDSII